MQSNTKVRRCWITVRGLGNELHWTVQLSLCFTVWFHLISAKFYLAYFILPLSNPVMILCGVAVLTNHHPAKVLQTDTHTDRQIERQTETQADRRTDWQTDRQTQADRRTDRQRDRQTETQADRQKERQTKTGRQTDRQADRQTNRRTGRQADR